VLSEGTQAPQFELPALVDGERRRVALDEYIGDDVVILAFYPADFNPACDAESCDLDELDLFTMQKDVTILGISPDSVYSHRAFAQQYDLKVPLLADTDGTVAAKYDIAIEDDIGQQLLERAVAVVDHDGEIAYAWSTDDMRRLPRVEELKDAIADTGGDDTAFARYRVGHAHYTEGRRSFTAAMQAFQQSDWMIAQTDFKQAREEFEEAADQFDTALRFVDDDTVRPIYEGANTKATSLWQAADWLTQAASAYSSGSGAEGQQLRDDADRPLEDARRYAEPPDPDEPWPPERETLEKDPEEEHSILPTESEEEDATLTVDIDAEMDAGETVPVEETADDTPAAPPDDTAESEATPDDEEDIDDDEIAEIQAELEANHPEEEPSPEDIPEEPELTAIQSELAANNPDVEPTVEDIPKAPTTIVDAPPMATDDAAQDTDPDGTDDDSTADGDGTAPTDEGDIDAGDPDSAAADDATRANEPETAGDDDAKAKAKAELAELQAELGVSLPGSETDESGDEADDHPAEDEPHADE
jgi:peroxiredoxin